MYCRNCGSEVMDSAKFCPHCGQNLQDKSSLFFGDDDTVTTEQQAEQFSFNQQLSNPKREKKKKRPSVFGIVGFGLTMISSIFLFYTFIFSVTSLYDATLVFGILTLFCDIPAFIFSVFGMSETNKKQLKLKGFPLSGIIVSIFVFFITIILVGV